MAWHVAHALDKVEVTLYLPTQVTGPGVVMQVAGRASTRRANLWTYQELFTEELDQEKGYGVGDAVHHVALVCMQDRPNTLERLQFALRGGLAWEQGELF